MTQPPSPSAAALGAAMALIEQLQHEPVDPLDDDIVPTALALDAFAAQVVAAAPKTLVSVCPHPAKCEEMAWAAERAKPAASDEIIAADCIKEYCDYDQGDWNPLIKSFAVALAERGERERERAARIAEDCAGDLTLVRLSAPLDRDGRKYADMLKSSIDTANSVAAAIRNQTLTGD